MISIPGRLPWISTFDIREMVARLWRLVTGEPWKNT
jgi:hypothetical protein